MTQKELHNKIRSYFRERLNIELTDEELKETVQSFVSMGKALFLYHLQKSGVDLSTVEL